MKTKRISQVVAALPPLALGIALFVANVPPPWVTRPYEPVGASIAGVTFIVTAVSALLAWVGYLAALRISKKFFKDSVIAIEITSIGLSVLIGLVGTPLVLLPFIILQLGHI